VTAPADLFAAFEARKTGAATAAVLPPYATTFDAHPPGAIAVGSPWTRAQFDGDFFESTPPPDTTACSLVFVQSKDGNTVTSDPSALGGGATDTHLIYEGLSRVDADGVLAGARTIGSGRMLFSVWHPELVALRAQLGRPRHPTQVVATLRGVDLNRGFLFNLPEIPVVLLTIGSCAQLLSRDLSTRPWVTVVQMDTPHDLAKAFAELHRLGIRRVSAIGGRTLARELIDAGIVQDLYLTTSATDGGEPHTPLYPPPIPGTVVLRKQGTGVETGVIFEHIVMDSGRRSR
jgi:riboflavin biosynthesis pyrimidine reductase